HFRQLASSLRELQSQTDPVFRDLLAAKLAAIGEEPLIGVLVFSFARVSAAVNMRFVDYFQQGKRWWFRLHEKGGKRHDVHAHHKAEEYMDQYLDAAGIAGDKKGFLFRSVDKSRRRLTENPMSRVDVLRMIKRRAAAVGLPYST